MNRREGLPINRFLSSCLPARLALTSILWCRGDRKSTKQAKVHLFFRLQPRKKDEPEKKVEEERKKNFCASFAQTHTKLPHLLPTFFTCRRDSKLSVKLQTRAFDVFFIYLSRRTFLCSKLRKKGEVCCLRKSFRFTCLRSEFANVEGDEG